MDRRAPFEEAETDAVAATEHPRETPTPAATESPATAPELALAARMHALGFLADGIAHDIANPLGAILAFASLLAADERIPSDLRTDARLLRDEADRTYRMVSTLLELARTRPPTERPIAIEAVLRGMLELAAYPLASVTVEVDLPADLPEGHADPSVVRQWVATALVEAVEALGWPTAHGRLRISGFEAGRAERAGGGASGWRSRPMPGAGRSSTSRCTMTARGHGDRAKAAMDGRMSADVPSESVAAPPVVLVCDDESSVRALLGRVLERAGCQAVEAASGEAALLLVETTVVDAVVSDHRLPGMSGIDLFERATALRPDLATRFVLLSGDADDPVIAAFTGATGVPVLAKPFELASIEAAVRRVVIPVTAP